VNFETKLFDQATLFYIKSSFCLEAIQEACSIFLTLFFPKESFGSFLWKITKDSKPKVLFCYVAFLGSEFS
jgi:hypothetical protein